MKKIFILLLIFLFINCNNEKEKEASEQKIINSFYYIVHLLQSHRTIKTVCANTGGTFVQTNIKSIDVYKNNSFSFSQQITEIHTTINFSCYQNHYIEFALNNLNILDLLITNCKNEDCDIDIHLKGEGRITYKTKFNGDFNTFTEIIAGEYKFVPVR